MGVTETTRLPAGWYPDPEGKNCRRWWDGREWTQYTAEFQRPTSIDLPEADAEAGHKIDASMKPDARMHRHESAERLGRWLAGAAHSLPRLRRAGKARGRRARRKAD